jgi:hypothetical protein
MFYFNLEISSNHEEEFIRYHLFSSLLGSLEKAARANLQVVSFPHRIDTTGSSISLVRITFTPA